MIDHLGHRRGTLVDCNKLNRILAWRDSFDLKRVAESFLSFTIAHENKKNNMTRMRQFHQREISMENVYIWAQNSEINSYCLSQESLYSEYRQLATIGLNQKYPFLEPNDGVQILF